MGEQFPPGDPSAPSVESIALKGALETRPQGGAISQLPPELLELAQQLGLDPENPEDLMQLMILLGGGGTNIPGGMPMEEEGMPMGGGMPPQGGM